ncbi:MAG: NADH-quinone oxidoreductase subunit N [Desulfococcaceae bacterium]
MIHPFAPELYCLTVSLLFLCFSLARPDAKRDYYIALILSAIGVALCLTSVHAEGELFSGTYRADLFSQVFKSMLFMGLFLVICLCTELKGVKEERHPEFYMLLWVSTLSMMLLVSNVHLLTIYAALELSSYSLYILVFLRKDRDYSVKSGLKYFFIGASASALMLFGLALLYGATGTAYVRELAEKIPGIIHRPDVMVGMLLILCGFFFKLALFPFHFWAPEVYEGAANQAGAYISTVSKVAAIAILLRIVSLTSGGSEQLVHILVVLSIVSMTVGNLCAIAQKDLKRLLAFSSIAHAGYVLIGILSMNPAGYASAVFYALTVLVLKFTCFLVVIKVASEGQNLKVEQLAGLHKRSPLLAMALMMALFGLAGIPPTIGFTGKLLLFTAAMQKGHLMLLFIAMFNVVISLYYYLLVVKAAYLTEPAEDLPALQISPQMKFLTAALVAVTVLAGFWPAYLIDLAHAAAGALM